jgi:hypothetical protein
MDQVSARVLLLVHIIAERAEENDRDRMNVSARTVIAILFSATMLASQRLPADAGCTPRNDWPRFSGNLLTKTAHVATAMPSSRWQ